QRACPPRRREDRRLRVWPETRGEERDMTTRPQRAHDCLINVHFGDMEQPEWMHRVKNEYFKQGDSIFGKWEMSKVLEEMDANGVEKAILSANVRERKSSPIRFAEA